jgi:hypothetical protein
MVRKHPAGGETFAEIGMSPVATTMFFFKFVSTFGSFFLAISHLSSFFYYIFDVSG